MNRSPSAVNKRRDPSPAVPSPPRARAKNAGNGRDRGLRIGALGMACAVVIAACGNPNAVVTGPNATPHGAVPDNHTAVLTWTPVRSMTGGRSLKNLAGYKIYYGTSPRTMRTVTLPDPTLTTYHITNLASGTWYFAVAAYTRDGVEGIQSNIATKTVH